MYFKTQHSIKVTLFLGVEMAVRYPGVLVRINMALTYCFQKITK
jgi:hypothetical protein